MPLILLHLFILLLQITLNYSRRLARLGLSLSILLHEYNPVGLDLLLLLSSVTFFHVFFSFNIYFHRHNQLLLKKFYELVSRGLLSLLTLFVFRSLRDANKCDYILQLHAYASATKEFQWKFSFVNGFLQHWNVFFYRFLSFNLSFIRCKHIFTKHLRVYVSFSILVSNLIWFLLNLLLIKRKSFNFMLHRCSNMK